MRGHAALPKPPNLLYNQVIILKARCRFVSTEA